MGRSLHVRLDLVAAARAHCVRDSRLVEAIGAIPRAQFVPGDLDARAYQDEPLPIPHGQVTTQPSLVAQMVEALELSPSERALEIGTGFGWQTALLARLVQPIGCGGADEVVPFEKRGSVLERIRHVTGAHFVRLYGEHGFAS